jgi:hypothetical protein
MKTSELLQLTGFTQNYTDFINSKRDDLQQASSRNGVVFTCGLFFILLAYGLYYIYTHRNQAKEASGLTSSACKVPGQITESMNNLVGQKLADSNFLNPSNWLKQSTALSMAKSPMGVLGAGLGIHALALLIIAWLVLGTALISITAHWPPGMSFFFIINAGLGRGFGTATPFGAESGAGQAATIANELLGAVLFGAALAFLVDALLERVRGDATNAVVVRCADDPALAAYFAGMPSGGQYHTVAIDTTHDG